MTRLFVLVAACLTLAACHEINSRPPEVDAGADGTTEQCGAFEIPAAKIDPALPWPGLECTDFPALCGLNVESTIHEPDTAKAIDIVFVGDGFTTAHLADYKALVDQLIHSLTDPPDAFVARRPNLFNFHRVDVVSQASRPDNADRTDTALAGCVDIDVTGDLVMDERLAALAAIANVKAQVDVVVVILNTNSGTPNASAGPRPDRPAFVRINPLVSTSILNHEFGHALFHLGDEYGTQPACFTPPDLPTFTTADYLLDIANLSTEDSGSKWADAHRGAEPGGMDFVHCLWHPGPPCLMKDGELPFCPVCAAAVVATLDAREGKQDGPPRCSLELADDLPTYAHGTLQARAVLFDRNFPSHYSFLVDGKEQASGDVAFWYQRVPVAVDTTRLSNGIHTLSVVCTDHLGAATTAKLDVKFQN